MKYSIKSLAVILAFSTLFIGCDSDEESKPDNYITIQGKKYQINDAVLRSDGPWDARFHDGVEKDTHYSFNLTFSDGEITMPNGPTAANSTYLISIGFYTTIADHTDHFTGGTFNAIPPQDFFGGKSPELESFFTVFFIRIDKNGDSIYDGTVDKMMDASLGTITITGSDDKFTINFDNTINDPDPHTPVTGKFDGNVELMF